MRIKIHPTLNIPIKENGMVFIPKASGHNEHWTFGSNRGRGYLGIRFRGKTYSVHRIVAETFIDNPNGYKTVDHIDRNPSNNDVKNLRWADLKMQCSNQYRVDQCLEKYGVRECENKKEYRRRYIQKYHKENREKRLEQMREYERLHKKERSEYYKQRRLKKKMTADNLGIE